MADSHPTRPPLLRGNTVPLYVRTLSSAAGSQQEQGRSQAEMALANGPLSARPEGYKGYGASPRNKPIALSSNDLLIL